MFVFHSVIVRESKPTPARIDSECQPKAGIDPTSIDADDELAGSKPEAARPASPPDATRFEPRAVDGRELRDGIDPALIPARFSRHHFASQAAKHIENCGIHRRAVFDTKLVRLQNPAARSA
jgi:hypothetical protein